MKRIWIVLSVCLWCVSMWASVGSVAQAQTDGVPLSDDSADAVSAPSEAMMDEDEGLMYTYGTVVNVGDGSLVVNEYDFDSDSFKEITYTFDAQVKLENMNSISGLTAGDSVEIYYVEEGEKKIARTIGKDEEDQMDDLESEDLEPAGVDPAKEALPADMSQ